MNENISELVIEDSPYANKEYFFIKRVVDIIGGIVGCILLIPISIMVKIAYLISGDTEPIFFKQDRIGKNGKTIKIYKFRSMVANADDILQKMLETDPEKAREYKRYKKLKDDPRITKVGKFIRDYSIDEIPQFISVVKGDMSLVGPRPYLIREKDDIGDYYDMIIKCKPGVSGYWQVNGRSHTDFVYRLELDEYYFKRRSLLLDFKIIIKTFIKVFKKDGAK